MATKKDQDDGNGEKAGRSEKGSETKGLTLRGRFTPGSEVRLTRASGPEQQRPGPADEVVDTQTVSGEGELTFSGTEPGERYFASGYVDGQPVDVRLTGREDPEDSFLAGYEPQPRERQKLADGSWADEPVKREKHDEQQIEGQTWLAQDQVGDDVPQRSATLRGAATPISAQERERATRQWRKQEPTDPILEPPATVQPQEEAEGDPARTAEPKDHKPAKGD
jgi:hypothetical protein